MKNLKKMNDVRIAFAYMFQLCYFGIDWGSLAVRVNVLASLL